MTTASSTNIDWNDKDLYRQVVEQVEEIGVQRMKAQPGMSEADFFSGAMAAMTALGLTPSKYPASWTLGLMFGKPPLARRMENKLRTRDDSRAAQVARPEPGSEIHDDQ
jgi:hypothetical protein